MSQYDYTQMAEENYYDIADGDFEPEVIYEKIKEELQKKSFSRALRRVMYKVYLSEIYPMQKQIPKDEFKEKFISLFKENKTPCAFTPTTAKLSTLAESCLTKDFVKRSTVLLLGFGLGLNTATVNRLLTEGIKEHGINPKDPFEVICWYCYEKRLPFSEFQRLWAEYETLEYKPAPEIPMYKEYTAVVQEYMCDIETEDELKDYLSSLKTSENKTGISKTSSEVFEELFEEAVSDLEKYRKSGKKLGANSIDEILYDTRDKNGNILSLKKYEFDEVFGGVRLTKQRIGKIRKEITRVNRYDIINLCFLIYAVKVGTADPEVEKLTKRQLKFLSFTNAFLEKCMLGAMNSANAYDNMILCCVMSEAPFDTFEALWELSKKE